MDAATVKAFRRAAKQPMILPYGPSRSGKSILAKSLLAFASKPRKN